jgi:prepilin peptidase CpaA
MDLISLIIWLAVCAVQDARHRQISNGLTLGAGVIALACILLTGHTWIGRDAADGGLALVLCLVLTMPGYLLGKLGGADVKLLAALALATDHLILLSTFIGAGLTIVLWVIAGQKIVSLTVQRLKAHNTQTNSKMSIKHPFAPYLFSGFILTLLCFH